MTFCTRKPEVNVYRLGNESYFMQFSKNSQLLKNVYNKICSLLEPVKGLRLIAPYFSLSKWTLFSIFSSKLIFKNYFEKTVPKLYLWIEYSISAISFDRDFKNKNQSSFRGRIFDLINPFMQPTKSAKVS